MNELNSIEDTDYKVKDYDYNNNWIVYNPEENED